MLDNGEKTLTEPIEPGSPDEFGLVQIWWGDGKGKTTAALGMGFRAAGRGYRVHLLQFMKGGAASVEDERGEYGAINAVPGFTYENLGHYGWHGMEDGSDDADHAAEARAGMRRAQEIIGAIEEDDLTATLQPDGPVQDGVHILILDEVLYAANRDLIDVDHLVDLVTKKPDHLELVLTGGHRKPDYLYEHADLITHVRKEKHPFDSGQRARKGTEY